MNNLPRYALAALPSVVLNQHTDVLVIGGGAAGLTAALTAAAYADVFVLTRGPLYESNSALAQGGIAAALDAADSPRAHVADTLVAGAGLTDEDAATVLANEAPALMCELATRGVPFERADTMHFALGLEGGHSARRIVHVGDATGWAVTAALIAEARAHPRIHLLEGWQAVDLLDRQGQIIGALARDPQGQWHRLLAGATVLASGGAGALYGLTSNQPAALGEGIAMAYRAGAEVADMEFVQFHPTVYRMPTGEGFLITEAARGEGGILFATTGERFMPAYDPRAELAPRDIVTRGIYAAMQRTGNDHVLLDLTHLPATRIEQHFPTICARLREHGLDPVRQPIPVAPAAHYLMGGVRTDLTGATSLPGLFAAGEVACTGVHGANRLASNSLLECIVFGRRAGQAALQWADAEDSRREGVHLELVPERNAFLTASPAPAAWRASLATIMQSYAGPLRDGAGLGEGYVQLNEWPEQADCDDPEAITAVNAATTARLIIRAASLRQESRGGHFRRDFPQASETWRGHSVQQRSHEPVTVASLAQCAPIAHAAD
ncbi:MAG: L-aspartate oxidase [Chloroflexia bacterium]|nr:L-aspartate oxidase [Chloroflexia bacterium]